MIKCQLAMGYRGSLVELIGSTSINLQFGQLPCNPVKNVAYICLAYTEYRLAPYSPACDLRTLGLTYTTPQRSLRSVPFTDISLFCDGNNPGKPFCTALLSFVPAYLGYDRYYTYPITPVFLPAMILY